MAAPRILVATESFSTDVLGYPRAVAQGETFREGHALTEAHPGGFEEWTVDNEFERATARPGEKRNRRKATKSTESSKASEPSEDSDSSEASETGESSNSAEASSESGKES